MKKKNHKVATRSKRRIRSAGKKYISLPATLEGLGKSYEALVRELAKR